MKEEDQIKKEEGDANPGLQQEGLMFGQIKEENDEASYTKCKDCGFQSSTFLTLRVHIEMKHFNLYYCCNRCTYQTKEKYIVKNHMKKKHEEFDLNKLDFECKKCDVREPMIVYKDHIKLFHQDFKYLFMGSMPKLPERLWLKNQKCKFCDYTDSATSVKSHVEYQHMTMKYFCVVCNEKNTDRSKMRVHIKQQHYDIKTDGQAISGRIPYEFIRDRMKSVCLTCNEQVNASENLTPHILSKHPNNNKNNRKRKGKNGNGEFKCNLCDYTSNVKFCLRNHMMVRHMKTLFECSCGFKTRQMSTMRLHEKKHNIPTTTSTCSVCAFISKDTDSFNKHVLDVHLPYLRLSKMKRKNMAVNKESRTYSCEECHYKCSRSILLRKHVMVKHMKTNFKCSVCAHATTFLDLMFKHVNENHPKNTEFTSECNKCDFKTEDFSNFKYHTRLIHLSHRGYDHRKAVKIDKILVTHDEEPTYKCYQCNVETLNKTNIIDHIFENHDVNDNLEEEDQLDEILKYLKMLCKGCGFEGTFENWNEHKDEKVFREVPNIKMEKGPCVLCGSHTNSAPDALIHKLLIHGKCKYSCKRCEYDSNTQGELKRHSKLEHNKVAINFACGHCDVRQQTVIQMNFHMETSHQDIYNLKTDLELLKCEVCEFQHVSSRRMGMHRTRLHPDQVGVNLNISTSTCDKCNKEFKTKDQAMRHVRVKHTDHVYKCKEGNCKFQTKHDSAIYRHKQVVHMGIKIKCSQCDQKFTRNEYLKEHMTKIHL